ncbi:MAG TPA: nuclease-related domain-containing protein [Marmoricola sp.]|nr:nuclease-related domain-containing protein [Marmoricola sp.]
MAELSAQPRPARSRDVQGRSTRSARGPQRKGEHEQATAAGLDLLRVLGWLVLHDVTIPADPANGVAEVAVDHVLAGPPGVYVVNTVSWSGPIAAADGVLTVGKTDHSDVLVEAAAAADVVRTLLGGTPVAPLLCFERLEAVAGVAGDVALCASENILDLLTSQPQILDGAAVAQASARLAAACRALRGAPTVAAKAPVHDQPAPRPVVGPTVEELARARAEQLAAQAAADAAEKSAELVGEPERHETHERHGLARAFRRSRRGAVVADPVVEPVLDQPAVEPLIEPGPASVAAEPTDAEDARSGIGPDLAGADDSSGEPPSAEPAPLEVGPVEVGPVGGPSVESGSEMTVARLSNAAVAEAGAALWRSLTESAHDHGGGHHDDVVAEPHVEDHGRPDEPVVQLESGPGFGAVEELDVEAAFAEAEARQREAEECEAAAGAGPVPMPAGLDEVSEPREEDPELEAQLQAAREAQEARARAVQELLEQARREAEEAEARELAERERAEAEERARLEAEARERAEAEARARLEAEAREREERERAEREARERAEAEERARLEAEARERAERERAEREERERAEAEAREQAEREERERAEAEERRRLEEEAREQAEQQQRREEEAQEAAARAAWEARLRTAREAREREAHEAGAVGDGRDQGVMAVIRAHQPDVRQAELLLPEPIVPASAGVTTAEHTAAAVPAAEPVESTADVDPGTWEPAVDATPDVVDAELQVEEPQWEAQAAVVAPRERASARVSDADVVDAPLAEPRLDASGDEQPRGLRASWSRRRRRRAAEAEDGASPGQRFPARAMVHVALGALLIAGVIVGAPRAHDAVSWVRHLAGGSDGTAVGTLVDVGADTEHPAVEVLAGAPVDVPPAVAAAGKGKHLVVVPLRLQNRGTEPWPVPVAARVTVMDDLGVTHPVAKAVKAVKAYPLLPGRATVAPDQETKGYVAFTVPDGRTVTSVTLGLSQSGKDAVTWQVRP